MGELSGGNTYITFPTEADVTSQGSPNTGQDILVSSLLLLALLLSEHFSLGASVFQPVKWRWLKRKQKLNRRFSLDITWTSHSEPEQIIRQDRFRKSIQVKKISLQYCSYERGHGGSYICTHMYEWAGKCVPILVYYLSRTRSRAKALQGPCAP